MPDPATARDILTPSALNRLVRGLLEDALPPVWVEGEISNLARPASGHLYFSLKDAGAQIRCAMFRSRSVGLRFTPRDGSKVLVRGRVGLYEPRGDYQLVAEHMEEAGEGALQREFERLKQKLAAEGLFDAAHKRPLPRFPRCIGILSSPSGAAVHDVLSVLRRRFALANVELLPVPVQGKEAPAAILAMLQRAIAARRHDVLLVTRGGGSLEDLWAFNDEALARAIAASPIPVVSAVGHEVDFTLADFAADVRAATPSVAGELLVPDARELDLRIAQRAARLERCLTRQHEILAQRLDQVAARLHAQRPARRLQRDGERLDALAARLARLGMTRGPRQRLDAARVRLAAVDPRRQCALAASTLAGLAERLRQAAGRDGERRATRLAAVSRALHAVSPLATLERGYAILFDATGRVVRSAAAIAPGATVEARLADGRVRLRRDEP